MAKYLAEIGYEVKACITCGVGYALPSDFIEDRREDHKSFYCPNGHKSYYPGKNEKEELAEKLEKAEACCDIYKNRERRRDYQRRYYKGQLTRLKKGEGSASICEVRDG